MVEVFKTNISNETEASRALMRLSARFPAHKIDFDIEDCDHVLRIEGRDLDASHVIREMGAMKYYCVVME